MMWVAKVFHKSQLGLFREDRKPSVAAFIKGAVHRWKYLEQVSREREQLGKLTDEQLRDVGLHRADADHERARDYFDVPENRR